MRMTPRPYQLQCVEQTANAFEESSKVLGVLPTGAGKTCVFSWIAKRRAEAGQKTLILAHREELIDQAIQKLYAATGIKAGKEKAEARAGVDSQVVVGSIQTMAGAPRLSVWPKDYFGLVVVDECHHGLASSYQTILKHFDEHADVLGVTATPDRGDARNLGEYFERIAFQIPLFDLINQGYLSKIVVKAVPMQIDLESVKSTAGDFDSSQLGHAIEPYLDDIAAAIRDHAPMRRTLCFVPLVQTSVKLVDALKRIGLRAAHVDGESEDRFEISERMANGELDVVSNAMLWTEGYDNPSIDCVAMLRPTRSRALYSQCVGRGTRVCEGKENLLLLDFLWNHEKHRLCRPASLISECEAHEDIITEISLGKAGGQSQEQEELDLGKLASAAMHEREKRMLAKMAEHKNKQSVVMSADEFAASHNAISLADYEPVMQWERESVTDAQRRRLKSAKIDLESVRGKGHASKLIGLMVEAEKQTPATNGQKFRMRQAGIPNWANATAADARRFFAGMNSK